MILEEFDIIGKAHRLHRANDIPVMESEKQGKADREKDEYQEVYHIRRNQDIRGYGGMDLHVQSWLIGDTIDLLHALHL